MPDRVNECQPAASQEPAPLVSLLKKPTEPTFSSHYSFCIKECPTPPVITDPKNPVLTWTHQCLFNLTQRGPSMPRNPFNHCWVGEDEKTLNTLEHTPRTQITGPFCAEMQTEVQKDLGQLSPHLKGIVLTG